MGAPVKTIKSLPPQAQSTAQKLAVVGFREGMWTYAPNHDLAVPGMGTQVRDDADRAPKNTVVHYMEVMKPFTLNRDQLIMPPVVFTRDKHLIDGWTRSEAARKLGWMTYPAIVLNDDWEGAPAPIMELFDMAGTILNVTHGRGLSTANLERLILKVTAGQDMSAPGAAADIARKMQCSRTMVTNLLMAQDAKNRARDLVAKGLLDADLDAPHLTRTHWANLGNWSDKLHDEFAAFLDLIITAKLSTNEQRTVFNAVNAKHDAREKLDVIAAEKESRDGVVSGYHGRPPEPAQLRQAAGKFTKFLNDPSRGVERSLDVKTRRNHVQVIEAVLESCYKILAEQRGYDGKLLRQQAEQG